MREFPRYRRRFGKHHARNGCGEAAGYLKLDLVRNSSILQQFYTLVLAHKSYEIKVYYTSKHGHDTAITPSELKFCLEIVLPEGSPLRLC